MKFRHRSPNDKSISGGGFGSVVSFNEPSTTPPPLYPPAGTTLQTLYGETYPIENGGNSVYANGNYYPNQMGDVNLVADGNGGSYIDWYSITNIAYKTYGSVILSESGNTYVDINGNNYINGYWGNSYYHDGNGNSYSAGNTSYYSYGSMIVTLGGYTTVDVNGANLINGTYTDDYFSDGYGSYYSSGSSSYYTAGTYLGLDPVSNSYGSYIELDYNYFYPQRINYYVYADGGSGWYSNSDGLVSYWPYGTFFYSNSATYPVPDTSGNHYANGKNNSFYYDGDGGYYTSLTGSFLPNGTLIFENQSGSTSPVEVPSGSGNYFDSEYYGERYRWDGNGGYYYTYNWYKPYGEYITYDGYYYYYWDGGGSYYSF